jgi:hypothetical protein
VRDYHHKQAHASFHPFGCRQNGGVSTDTIFFFLQPG